MITLKRHLINDLDEYKRDLYSSPLVPCKGKLIYDPIREGLTKKNTGWAVVEIQGSIDKYYRWFLEKEYGIKTNRPAWGAHVSLIRGERLHPDLRHLWKKYNNKVFDFQLRTFLRFNNDTFPVDNHPSCSFWFLDVVSPELMDIRKELRLPTSYNLHLTIGRMYL